LIFGRDFYTIAFLTIHSMTLADQVNNDLKAAMLARNEAALRALRAVKSAILLAKTEKTANAELGAEDEMKLLQKLVKQRKESVDIYNAQGRADLAATEMEEIAVIEKYLPQQLSEEQIRNELKGIIESVGATSQADLGKVMAVASKHFAGRADNKLVSASIRALLA
jgi:uncharacterized protein